MIIFLGVKVGVYAGYAGGFLWSLAGGDGVSAPWFGSLFFLATSISLPGGNAVPAP